MDIQILVIEDDEHICNTVKAFLQCEGYHVDTSCHGEKALEMFFDKNYHLIILDILLPGLSGHELLKEFRKMIEAAICSQIQILQSQRKLRLMT